MTIASAPSSTISRACSDSRSIIGRVSLNVTTVDVTDLDTKVSWGDEAVLIGKQGTEEVTFEEMADKFASVHTEINLMAGFMNDVTYA